MSSVVALDYYQIIGVPRSASHDEVVHAYREKARLYHPDRNPGFIAEAEARLKALNEAYEVLGDSGRRRTYDLHPPRNATPAPPPSQQPQRPHPAQDLAAVTARLHTLADMTFSNHPSVSRANQARVPVADTTYRVSSNR
jgi:curved DNA-binding protein CbpA